METYITEIEMNYGIMRLEACRSVSVKCIWEMSILSKKIRWSIGSLQNADLLGGHPREQI